MEWISVKDRLPELEEDVLAYDPSLESISVGYLSAFLGHNPTWVIDFGQSISDCVTHWMPLPEPPKQI